MKNMESLICSCTQGFEWVNVRTSRKDQCDHIQPFVFSVLAGFRGDCGKYKAASLWANALNLHFQYPEAKRSPYL